METLELKNKLNLMEKYNLTAEEIMLVELLFLASIEEGHSEYLSTYLSLRVDKTDLRELLVSLQNKGVIVKSWKIPPKGSRFDPESVEFNKNFLNNYRKFSGELGIEFFETYPSTAVIQGTVTSLKNFSKVFDSEEQMYFWYGKSIGWNADKHQHVLDLVRWGKENNCQILNTNIGHFIRSKLWRDIEKYRDGEGVMTFDNLETI